MNYWRTLAGNYEEYKTVMGFVPQDDIVHEAGVWHFWAFPNVYWRWEKMGPWCSHRVMPKYGVPEKIDHIEWYLSCLVGKPMFVWVQIKEHYQVISRSWAQGWVILNWHSCNFEIFSAEFRAVKLIDSTAFWGPLIQSCDITTHPTPAPSKQDSELNGRGGRKTQGGWGSMDQIQKLVPSHERDVLVLLILGFMAGPHKVLWNGLTIIVIIYVFIYLSIYIYIHICIHKQRSRCSIEIV